MYVILFITFVFFWFLSFVLIMSNYNSIKKINIDIQELIINNKQYKEQIKNITDTINNAIKENREAFKDEQIKALQEELLKYQKGN